MPLERIKCVLRITKQKGRGKKSGRKYMFECAFLGGGGLEDGGGIQSLKARFGHRSHGLASTSRPYTQKNVSIVST